MPYNLRFHILLNGIVRWLFVFIALVWSVTIANNAFAQPEVNPDREEYYGLNVVSDMDTYNSMVKEDPTRALVNLEDSLAGLMLDIRYATANNFTGDVVYELPAAWARLPVALALREVQQELKGMGLALKLFDAYRPYRYTLKFYDLIGDTNFVAAPWRGSRHNRGCAVDVTLVSVESGEELEMPTPYDHFSEKASATYENLPENIKANRDMLITVMKRHGFTVMPSEWWHFDYEGWEQYELLDVPFQELENQYHR